ncbi:polyphosphate--glucose phosphotransferase, partial [Streptomyces sp. NPDC048845]|uniref:polyphosphate--glucose phosphotransferase n=1 Tax=Streptomyces sp. NPDC048845 TaxID=3155390 RepID=UPI003428DA91
MAANSGAQTPQTAPLSGQRTERTGPAEETGQILGVDIGGSGIKGAPVDLTRGDLAAARHKVLTPQPSTPDAVAGCVEEVVRHFGWTGPVGVTFPGVVRDGRTLTAANVDKGWVGRDARAMLADRIGLPVTVLNDADAAGVAEMSFGAGRGRDGTVVVLTLGTGIGSAVFIDGRLVPNTELGHLELDGHDAETRASTRAKDDEELSWTEWAGRVERRHSQHVRCPARLLRRGPATGPGGASAAPRRMA